MSWSGPCCWLPRRKDVRRKAAELAPKLGRFKEARENLTTLLKAQPDDGELELWLGQSHEALGRTGKHDAAAAEYREARDLYEKAIVHAPHQVDGYVRLAALLRGPLADPDRADQVMDAREVKNGLVASNPESFRAFSYGLATAGGMDSQEPRTTWPGRSNWPRTRPTCLWPPPNRPARRGTSMRPGRLLGRGMDRHPEVVRFYELLATLENRAGRPAEGLAALHRGLVAAPDRADLQWGVAESLIQAGKLDEASEAITRLRGREDMRTEMLDYLEGRVSAGKGRWAEAMPLLEKARACWPARPRSRSRRSRPTCCSPGATSGSATPSNNS